MTDANGIGSWQALASIRPTCLVAYSVLVADRGPKYTGSYIDLTQGKWIVSAGMTITNRIVDFGYMHFYPILSANVFLLGFLQRLLMY